MYCNHSKSSSQACQKQNQKNGRPRNELAVTQKLKLLVCFLIIVLGFLFQIGLQNKMRPYAKDYIYFQNWSSETMIQTVSVRELRDTPIETLWNIHIQPPAFDLIRATFVHVWPGRNIGDTVEHVDTLIYLLWAIVYSFLGLLIFLWMLNTTGMKVAIISSIVFLLHPACIFYTTFLDTTILTSFLVLLAYYLLWKIKNRDEVSIYLVIIVILSLFLTRSIFQLMFVGVFGFSLFLLGMPKRSLLIYSFITVGIVSIYFGKQYYKFGIMGTSSFTGRNLTRSVGIFTTDFRNYTLKMSRPEWKNEDLPRTLTEKRKVNGNINFNHIGYLELNSKLIRRYKKHMVKTPILQLIQSYKKNAELYFLPSSSQWAHSIVDRIFWRHCYDRVFSYPILIALLLLSGIIWITRVVIGKQHRQAIALMLPGLYIISITIMFEQGENARFKFFMEPIMYVFVVSQMFFALDAVKKKIAGEYKSRIH